MIVDCPDALTTLINAGISGGLISEGVAVTDTFVRTWVPRVARTDALDIQLQVVPSFRVKTLASRADDEIEIAPYVMVVKAVDPTINAEVDELARLMQEVEDYVERAKLTGALHTYSWIGQEPVQIREDVLQHERVFWGQLQVNYKVFD